MEIDFAKWAVVAHNDDTGLGRMAQDAVRVLGIGRHIVIPSERLRDKEPISPNTFRLDPKDGVGRVREALAKLDGIIFFERHSWHPALLSTARAIGVKSVCVPMWEWFRGTDAAWKQCDLFVCPTKLTLKIVQRCGWKNSLYLPWCLNLRQLQLREIRGSARSFFHNAGIVDADDRKGTRDTIEAFKCVKRKDIRLIVRMQTNAPLPELDDRIAVEIGNLPSARELYATGDVAIQPSKMEGVGFMVLEPVCCGLPVITLDAPPMNEFVKHRKLLVRPRWFKRSAFPKRAAGIRAAHLRVPNRGRLARAIEWCAENDLHRISRENRAWAERQFSPAGLRDKWSSVLKDRL